MDIRCPVCETSFEVGDGHSVVTEKDGLGYLVPKTIRKGEKKMTKEDRIKLLKEAGFDIEKMLNNGFDIDEYSSDPVVEKIKNNGYAHNRILDRRFLPAQHLRLSAWLDGATDDTYYRDRLRKKSTAYVIRVMIDEVHTLSKMQAKDKEFEIRSLFFSPYVISTTMKSINKGFARRLSKERRFKYGGKTYIKNYRMPNLVNGMMFKEDMDAVQQKLDILASQVVEQSDYSVIESLLKKWKSNITFNVYCPLCEEWIRAYQGAGAYYTLRNLIKFHNISLKTDKESYKGKPVTEQVKALDKITRQCFEHQVMPQSYVLQAILKKSLGNYSLQKNIENTLS